MNLSIIVATALVASIIAGGLMTGGIALLLRFRRFDATARHALWFATLVAIALLPLAGIAASLVQATRVPATTTWVAQTPPVVHSGTATAPKSAAQSNVGASRDMPAVAGGASASSKSTIEGPGQATTAATAFEWTRPALRLPSGIAASSLPLLGLLAAVALAGLIWLGISVVRIGAVKRRSSPLDESLADDLPWLTETHSGRETYLRLSYEIEAPVAIGFNRPVILIPTELATKSGLGEIEDLVIHEHAHLCRYDDYTNLVQRIIERVFWFNPFVWIVGRRIALEREIAADDAVVARTEDRTRYADALWRLVREMRMPTHTLVAPGALFTRKQISVRIEALLAPGRAQLRHLGPASAAFAAAAGLMSCAIVALAAPPLEVPAPAAPPATASTAWHASDEHKPNAAPRLQNENVVALAGLSDLISSQLADVASSADAPDARASNVRILELQREVSRLKEKLAFMERLATKVKLPTLAHRIAALAAKAETLDLQLGTKAAAVPAAAPQSHAQAQTAQTVKVPATIAQSPRDHAVVPPSQVHVPSESSDEKIAVRVPPTDVTVPRIDVDVPGVHVAVPPVSVHVPSVSVHVPQVSVHVPPVHVHVPQGHAYASSSSQVVAALADAKDSSNTTLTRTLIQRCEGCDLSGRDLRNIDLHGLTLSGIDLSKADLRGANLRGATLNGADLTKANLDGADLTDARITGADIAGASFKGARMSGVQFVGISLRNGSFDNAGVREILMRGCTGCDLSHMDLHGIDLHDVKLTGAELGHTDLTGANLRGAVFSGVSFDYANLDRADLTNAVLTGCSLHHTSMQNTRLDGIRLSGTSLGE